MKLWNEVCVTDPKAVKKITGPDLALLAKAVLHY
jgi:hypothetical protein